MWHFKSFLVFYFNIKQYRTAGLVSMTVLHAEYLPVWDQIFNLKYLPSCRQSYSWVKLQCSPFECPQFAFNCGAANQKVWKACTLEFKATSGGITSLEERPVLYFLNSKHRLSGRNKPNMSTRMHQKVIVLLPSLISRCIVKVHKKAQMIHIDNIWRE